MFNIKCTGSTSTMSTEKQSPSTEGKATCHIHHAHNEAIKFAIDGEPYRTHAPELTPYDLLKDFAGVDPTTHHLVQIDGKHRESYAGRETEPIKMHDKIKFQIVSNECATVSDPVVRTGVDAFISGLKALGLNPASLPDKPDHVFCDYEVSSGKRAGLKVKQGFVVPPDFPVTPPGGPHISQALYPIQSGGNHPTGGIHASPFGTEWQYWSRPVPGWAKGKKTVGAYMSHIDRLWATQ